ncbi:DNA-binding CsgD family transcriptional regulator/KaiC/GvpD/RAD55 family RecA-like ATPase [Saccharothrix coeruleofusca]|uniref:AAA family ATPase n=1 Tax=Saccharothrix coeruleofusca TaxID=33919 RepID=UPI001AE10EE1|nr:LuxR family transcriptional regulator [Saccharothrix coeruleofusca]MBP2336798.1 DNA-binding CsgD family transcriptional regulator/KaiC/GvpD/RAD55 family RecA-like ATPase [Saccharothrix coeruleofusca]
MTRGAGACARAVRDSGELVERDSERGVLDAVVRMLGAGRSHAVVVRGEPGVGRSRLLAEVVTEADRVGAVVVAARARLPESDVRFGVAAQLFSALPDADPDGWSTADRADLPRLCQVLLAAARRRPLVVVVDDAQWVDPESDALLRMLLRRLHHAPLVVAVATDGSRPDPADEEALPPEDCAVLRPLPLSEDGVRLLCRAVCGTAPDDEFVRAAAAATGGRPGVLVPALREFADGGEPVASGVDRFAALVAEHRTGRLDAVLDGLRGSALDLLRALAVVGDDLELRFVRSIAGSVRREEADQLRTAGLAVGQERMRPADPVVAERALAGMAVWARRALHASAAELAHRIAAPDQVVGRILLGAPAVGSSWAPGVLHRAARRALAAGRDAEAATLLERALREPASPGERLRLLFDLALAQARHRPEGSDRTLVRIITGGWGGPDRARAADLLALRGDLATVRRLLAGRLTGRSAKDQPGHPELSALHAFVATVLVDGEELALRRQELPDDPVGAGVAAWRLAVAGVDLDRTRALARAALAAPPADQPLVLPRLSACAALVLADEADEAAAGLTAVLVDARRRGVRVAAAAALLGLAWLALRAGRLDEADGCLDQARAELPTASWAVLPQPLWLACRALVALERGRITDARRVLATELPVAAERGIAWAPLLYARGQVRLAAGDPRGALRDLQECGRRLAGKRWDNPALIGWRARAAQALDALGDAGGARALLAEETRAATAWGTPTVLGAVDLTAGSLSGDRAEAQSRMLRAERVLRDSPARLLHARAQLAAARVLRERGNAAEAAPLLEQAARTTRDCGARPLARAVDSLRTRGARPVEHHRNDAVLARAGLSPAETRAVELAASGLANPEIAGALGVTRRTVELHLTSAYRKLGIRGRAGLPAVLPDVVLPDVAERG